MPIPTVAQYNAQPLSGYNWIDSLLDSGGWNYIIEEVNGVATQRTYINYTFSTTEGNYQGDSPTAFNAAQMAATLAILAKVTSITGIVFNQVSNGNQADWHFASLDLEPGVAGIAKTRSSYSYSTQFINGTLVSSLSDTTRSVSVYLDTYSENVNPVAGNYGFETLLHEVGHALGLKHPFDVEVDNPATLPTAQDNNSNTLMTYTHSIANPSPSDFAPYDVAALKFLYGTDGLGGSWGWGTLGRVITGTNANEAFTETGGALQLLAGAGSDSLSIDWSTSTTAKTWVNTGANAAAVIDTSGSSIGGVETLNVIGSQGNDTFINWVNGTNDNIRGGNGNDVIATGSGDDNLEGGFGDDILHGEQGNDTIKGDAGSDSLYGWSGTDTLDGGDGTDKLYGGSENDTLNGGNGADELNGDDGQDLLRGGSGGDRIYGWNDSDTLYGEAGDDFLFGGAAVDVLSGGDGADQLNGDDGNDTLTGDAGNDSLYGWNDNDSMSGGDGNDILSGWSGDDILNGDAANDELSGNDGADTLTGGDGDDVMYGGLNSDTYNFAGNFGFDGVEDYDYVAGSTDVFNFQSIDSSQLWFSKYGNDLRITAIGTGNAVTINRWYENTVFQIEQIKTNDNKTLLASKVDNLVNAMAGLNPPLPGQTTLTQAQQAVLQPVLAANWI
jgi:Ca2+-binding RTX toxin-like protein